MRLHAGGGRRDGGGSGYSGRRAGSGLGDLVGDQHRWDGSDWREGDVVEAGCAMWRMMVGLVRVLVVLALLGAWENGGGKGSDAQRAVLQVDGLRAAAWIGIDGNV